MKRSACMFDYIYPKRRTAQHHQRTFLVDSMTVPPTDIPTAPERSSDADDIRRRFDEYAFVADTGVQVRFLRGGVIQELGPARGIERSIARSFDVDLRIEG